MNLCVNYNKRARNYPNILIFVEGENCLKISNMGKMKKRASLFGFEPANLKTKKYANRSYRHYWIHHTAICFVRYSFVIAYSASFYLEIYQPGPLIYIMFYDQSIRLLHHYFHRLFRLIDNDWLRKFCIDEFTLNGQCPILVTDKSLASIKLVSSMHCIYMVINTSSPIQGQTESDASWRFTFLTKLHNSP